MRLVTSVDAAQEVTNPKGKPICWHSVVLRIQDSRSWASKNTLICQTQKKGAAMPLLLPWSGSTDGKGPFFFTKEKVGLDPKGIPSLREYLGQSVHQKVARDVRF